MLTGMIQWGMRQSAEMENLMTSVERVLEYGRLPSEAELVREDTTTKETKETKEEKLGSDWPRTEATLVFENVWLKYAEDEKYVLRGLDFETAPKEKVRAIAYVKAAGVFHY